MPDSIRNRSVWIHVLVCLVTIFGLLGPYPARAEVESGTFVVTTTVDGNSWNNYLSLREALLVARGGTSATGLNRSLNDSEAALLSGCTFAGGTNARTITGGCGAGLPDTITFNMSGSVILLTSALPPVSDNNTVIDGGEVIVPILDASGIGANDGLTISGSNNIIKNILITKSPHNAFLVSGDSNTLDGVVANQSTQSGILISGSSNTITNAKVGVNKVYTCQPNLLDGIRIAADAQYNHISNTVASCNQFYGIRLLAGSVSGSNMIGPNNMIGTDLSALTDLGNGASGISIQSNANQVSQNLIRYNAYHGVEINSSANVVMTNTITTNGYDGLLLYGAATNNYIGCNLLCLKLGGNRLSGNGHYGIEFSSAGVGFNLVMGNKIGQSVDGLSAEANLYGGVLIDAAHDNTLGDAGPRANFIGGNHGNGVTLTNGAYQNTFNTNYVGISQVDNVLSPLGNTSLGFLIYNGAHNNHIGGVVAQDRWNMIMFNQEGGVMVTGAATANNTIGGNTISKNSNFGLEIAVSAHGNQIGEDEAHLNLILSNLGPGILLASGAYSNTIGYNQVGGDINIPGALSGNQGHGIWISNGAHGNTIGVYKPGNSGPYSLTALSNTLDGVRIEGSNTNNNLVQYALISDNLGSGVVISSTASSNNISENLIGGASANTNLPNGRYGVKITGGANHNNVLSNIIRSNQSGGVSITGPASSFNSVDGNTIADNLGAGINVGDSASSNTFGETYNNSNDVYGTSGSGIDLNTGAFGNTFISNRIGTNIDLKVLPNLGSGVLLRSGAHNNTFNYNQISYNARQGIYLRDPGTYANDLTQNAVTLNGLDGILEGSGASENWWSGMVFNKNGGLGIDKLGADDTNNHFDSPRPLITAVQKNGGTISMQGKASPSTPGSIVVTVEVYKAVVNTAGYAEGIGNVGTATTASNGSWSLQFNNPDPGCYVAFQTLRNIQDGTKTSSEFSQSTCTLFTPLVKR